MTRKVVIRHTERAWDLEELVAKVDKKRSKGWEPIGRIYCPRCGAFEQAMVKYEEVEE